MARRRAPDPQLGVFSTTLVVDGVPVALDAHLARLAASASELYGAALPPSAAASAREHARGHELALLRVTVVPVAGSAEVGVGTAVEPVERAAVLPGAAGAIELRSTPLDDWPAAHKWVDRAALQALHAQVAPAVPLLVGDDGSVRETIRGNVFALGADGVLRTPPADGAILPGVARAQLIALARELGIDVREEPLARDALATASAVFATNAVRGIEPVRSVDGAAVSRDAAVMHRFSVQIAERWSLRQLDRRPLRH